MAVSRKSFDVFCNTCDEVRLAYTDQYNSRLERCTVCGQDAAAPPRHESRRVLGTEEIAQRSWDEAPYWPEQKFVFETVISVEEMTPTMRARVMSKKAARRARRRVGK